MLAVKTALQAAAAANHLQGTLFLANKLRGLSVRIATSLREPRTRGLDHPALARHRGLKELRGPPLSSAAPQRPASHPRAPWRWGTPPSPGHSTPCSSGGAGRQVCAWRQTHAGLEEDAALRWVGRGGDVAPHSPAVCSALFQPDP